MSKTKTGNHGGTNGSTGDHDGSPTSSGPVPKSTAPPAKSGKGDTSSGPGSPAKGGQSPGAKPAGPPPSGANGFKHVPEHVESGAKGFDASAARIEAAHSKLAGVLQAKGSFWNKDGLGQAFGKVFEPVSTGHSRAGGALQQAVKKTADNLRSGSARTSKTDQAVAKRFGERVWSLDKAKGNDGPKGDGGGGPGNGGGKDGGGPGRRGTPVYFVDEHGQINQVVNGKLVPVDPKDASGIRRIMTGDQVKVNIKTDKSGNQKTTPNGLPIKVPVPGGKGRWDRFAKQQERDTGQKPDMVRSQPLPGPNDLSRAVEDTRRATGDYAGNNYASLRYQGDNSEDFILVGRSHNNNSHSERAIGLPMVHNNMQDGVSSLYTERAPCQVNRATGGAGCDIWVDLHLNNRDANNPLTVNHTADFESSRLDGADRNGPFNEYIGDLQRHHASGNTSGLAGTRNYRYP